MRLVYPVSMVALLCLSCQQPPTAESCKRFLPKRQKEPVARVVVNKQRPLIKTTQKRKVVLSDRWIKKKWIPFGPKRIQWSLEYLHIHVDEKATSILIDPKVIVVHWTASPDLASSWKLFAPARIPSARRYVRKFGRVNVSAHFLVDTDGTVYRMVPERYLARHVIGLNQVSLGIENVGGVKGKPLHDAQLEANAKLIRYLASKYNIQYLIGHYEYRKLERTPLFREKIKSYRTGKIDPGRGFMKRLRQKLKDLHLQGPPK